MATKREALDRLIEQARKDPAFFHGLVFNPEATLAGVEYLDRREKGKIVEIAPEDVIAGLAGVFVNPGGDIAECDLTCGAGSCGDTCASSCIHTCDESCNHTCGEASCGHTSKFPGREEIVSQPWRTFYGGGRTFFRATRRFR